MLLFVGALPLPLARQPVLEGAGAGMGRAGGAQRVLSSLVPAAGASHSTSPDFHSLEVVLELPGLTLGCLSDVAVFNLRPKELLIID